MIKFSPLFKKKINRFRSIKRGYYSFIILIMLFTASMFSGLIANNRAIIVCFNGSYYFPTYSSMLTGSFFDQNYEYEVKYRELSKIFKEQNSGNWLIMPPIPYNPYENDFKEGIYPPESPSFSAKHFMGTDTMGRDVACRLIYGFKIAMIFSMILLFVNYCLGISIGCFMGYFGGKFDIIFQRVIEIWSNIPFLYVIIIISSIVVPNLFMLIVIMSFFGWISMTWVMRTITYKEKEREYVLSARAMGAGSFRIIFKHILPNTIAVIVTFVPFAISGGIVSLTSLDYLGFGLPPPTPSWGELLGQGWANMDAWWIVTSVIFAMTFTLLLVTFIGEAVREAFDPKLYTIYE